MLFAKFVGVEDKLGSLEDIGAIDSVEEFMSVAEGWKANARKDLGIDDLFSSRILIYDDKNKEVNACTVGDVMCDENGSLKAEIVNSLCKVYEAEKDADNLSPMQLKFFDNPDDDFQMVLDEIGTMSSATGFGAYRTRVSGKVLAEAFKVDGVGSESLAVGMETMAKAASKPAHKTIKQEDGTKVKVNDYYMNRVSSKEKMLQKITATGYDALNARYKDINLPGNKVAYGVEDFELFCEIWQDAQDRAHFEAELNTINSMPNGPASVGGEMHIKHGSVGYSTYQGPEV